MPPPGGRTGPDAADVDGATRLAERLRAAGTVGVAVTMVDNSGVTRVKGVPVGRLAAAAERGIGSPPVFDAFGIDDSIAPAGGAVGDLRMVPDVGALVALAASPGWAWAPADRRQVDGSPHPGCQRSFARRMVEEAAAAGLTLEMAFETEFVLDAGSGGDLHPVTTAPGYGMGRLLDVSDFGRDLLDALERQEVGVEQFHPEYAASQMELSVTPQGPVAAADRVVLVRHTIRAVAARRGWRVSLSPLVSVAGVGSGAHVHLSVWRGGTNLLAERDGELPPEGAAWMAGVLDALPGLLAVTAPSAASHLRLQPSLWSAPWRCWGRENREAALRLVAGSPPAPGDGSAANVEVKVVDASANPYLVVGSLIAAGLDGVRRGAVLAAPVGVDPATLSEEERGAAGVERLPDSQGAALDAFERTPLLRTAMGDVLADTWLSTRRSEEERFREAPAEEIAAASRWVW